jgi:hypothetical protein
MSNSPTSLSEAYATPSVAFEEDNRHLLQELKFYKQKCANLEADLDASRQSQDVDVQRLTDRLQKLSVRAAGWHITSHHLYRTDAC